MVFLTRTNKKTDSVTPLIMCLINFAMILMGLNFHSSKAFGGEVAISDSRVAVLLVDTDYVMGTVEEGVYGQFLEHINHSVIDGLYAEQIRGQGFEGKDYGTYWEPFGNNGQARLENIDFNNGQRSVKLTVDNGTAGIRQGRIYLQEGYDYDGLLWLKPEQGSVQVTLRAKDSEGNVIAEVPLKTSGSEWQEVNYSFLCRKRDTRSMIEIAAGGNGSVLVDFISMMRADVRKNGMFRPDLYKALKDMKPSFIRWPGGSFASTYKWKDGIGPKVSRKYTPNEMWGGYSDYYGFGIDEFLELCRQLDCVPLVVLAATDSKDKQMLQDAMDLIHYINDPATTEWGKKRAANGHSEPYNVKYFQIDNEPMNHNHNAESYAEIVNVYGSEIRKIDPELKIVACGQKRSNDMQWSKKLIDIAGDNFDVLGCHNYEYEPENFMVGVKRIYDYLDKLCDYIRVSDHPNIKVAVLEWSLCRTYDWRAGLHSAGSLIAYERLSPELDMTCPALLMRNTTDNPQWRAFIYHDHVSWFPGSGYIVEKLFRDHFAPKHYSSSTGTFSDIENRAQFFDDIPQMIPENWKPDTVDTIATGSEDGKRIVVKAVNYEDISNTLLIRLQGKNLPEKANVKVYSISAGLNDMCSLEEPDEIKPVESEIPYSKDLAIEMKPYSVAVVEVREK
jgi:alpha-N-arabinofuranosidase